MYLACQHADNLFPLELYLKYSLQRIEERVSGKRKMILWDEALDGIAAGLTEVKEEYAPGSIAGYHGTEPWQSSLSSTLIAHPLGCPNVINTGLHICYTPSGVVGTCTVGHSVIVVFKNTVDGILSIVRRKMG
jgi:anaerobic selenocysteine-containing dehydrogenase